MGTVNYLTVEGEVLSENRLGVDLDYIPDPLGSTAKLVNTSQEVTDTFSWWPYGEQFARTGTSPTPFGFVGVTGYFADAAGYAVYIRARTFMPVFTTWGRSDTVWPYQLAYGYVESNPTSTVDPLGMQGHIRRTRPQKPPPPAHQPSGTCLDYCNASWNWNMQQCLQSYNLCGQMHVQNKVCNSILQDCINNAENSDIKCVENCCGVDLGNPPPVYPLPWGGYPWDPRRPFPPVIPRGPGQYPPGPIVPYPLLPSY